MKALQKLFHKKKLLFYPPGGEHEHEKADSGGEEDLCGRAWHGRAGGVELLPRPLPRNSHRLAGQETLEDGTGPLLTLLPVEMT